MCSEVMHNYHIMPPLIITYHMYKALAQLQDHPRLIPWPHSCLFSTPSALARVAESAHAHDSHMYALRIWTKWPPAVLLFRTKNGRTQFYRNEMSPNQLNISGTLRKGSFNPQYSLFVCCSFRFCCKPKWLEFIFILKPVFQGGSCPPCPIARYGPAHPQTHMHACKHTLLHFDKHHLIYTNIHRIHALNRKIIKRIIIKLTYYILFCYSLWGYRSW